MTEKQSNKDQIWLTVFMVLPVVLLANLGGELAKMIGVSSLLTSALLGGLGGIIGFALSQLAKKLSTPIKLVILVAFIIAFGITARLFMVAKSDDQLISEDWIEQKIGTIKFESPTKVSLRSSSLPKGTEHFYSSLEVYSDDNEERIITFINAQILKNSLDLADSFGGSLEGMLNKIGITDVSLLDDSYIDNEEVIAKFRFELNAQAVIGFGYMRHVGRSLQAIWLMPIKRGFSPAYIDEFELGIEPE